jgi:hypothetical protein
MSGQTSNKQQLVGFAPYRQKERMAQPARLRHSLWLRRQDLKCSNLVFSAFVTT